ncbi:GNAT family N-acetyltransferase [Pseudomonas sp. Irchel 3A5]|uniref:GNAT family N-acetyltransferase n=1 Tax=Pseudomonas sp. Irchel 3A5 TaxID=2008911 RepID=UPI000BA354F8|nr:GNAT family N-acetyltransferase [Pseudomonas sp. Irchel 3A5]
MSAVEIVAVAPQEIPAVVDFVLRARAEIFPKLDSAGMPADLANFAQVYSEQGGGRFLIARSHGQIVAAIGYLPYDGRFPQLDYGQRKAVEIVRLFVIPEYRRSGLATTIFQALKARAVEQGVDVLYLHTHPFLPGAIGFWERQGFRVVDVENDPVWQTTHMECGLV